MLLLLFLALSAAAALARKPTGQLAKARSIAVAATPVAFDRGKPQQKKFGKLIWLGTLQLSSTEPFFGGYSGIAVEASGRRIIAVSDAGTWLTADLEYRGGRVAGLVNAMVGPLRARSGRPVRRREIDAEGLEIRAPGELLIAFEQIHRIGRFPFSGASVGTPKQYLTLPPAARSAKGNVGLEAVAVIRSGPASGSVLVLTEENLDKEGNHRGWLVGGKTPGEIRIKRIAGFALTGATTLPDGDVVVLERRFRFSEGVKMRIRRFSAARFRPGALLDGEILFATDDLREIDNMEGITAHRDADGRTILTLISDDNFNAIFQRTLLMQFALPDG